MGWNVGNLKIIYGDMIDYLMSGHLVDNIMIMCGENVDFLNKFPTFSLSNNCNPAPMKAIRLFLDSVSFFCPKIKEVDFRL